jgi:hypothetical protein
LPVRCPNQKTLRFPWYLVKLETMKTLPFIKTALIITLMTLGLTGCAAKYTHPTKTTQDFERDRKRVSRFVKKQGTALRIKKGGVGYFGNLLYLM